MELGSYILTSLMGTPRPARSPIKPARKEQPNGKNIYESRDYYKAEGEEAARMISSWEKSQHPLSTGVVPMYYNTLHLKHQNVDKIANPNYQKGLVLTVLDSLDQATKDQIQSKVAAKSVMGHVHDGARAQSGDGALEQEWGQISGVEAGGNIATDKGALAQLGGSLLPNRGYEDFTHNNMVPFYRGSLKQNMATDNRMFGDKLERFTGQFKLNHQQKQEVGPFFSPVTGMTNIYGSSEKRDLTRYIPSNTGKKHSELPFEQIKVGPGLNKGFTAQPSGGFHQTTRIMPKPTEELRVDPVFEQEGRINHGRSLTQERTAIQQMFKNRPELLVENKNGERNFTTVGQVKGRSLRPSMMLRDTHRKKSRQLIQHAKMAGDSKHRIAPKAKVSHRVNYFNTPFRNAILAEGKKVNDFGRSGVRNRLNERAVTGTRNHLLNPKSWVSAIVAPLLDSARKTRKQHYINHPRPNGNAKPSNGKHRTYDPVTWTPKTTIRETTEDSNYLGQVGAGRKQPRSFDPASWAAKTTIRETTEDSNYLGQVGAGRKQPRSFDPATWAPKTTIRETTEDSDYVGQVGTGKKKHIAFDPATWAAKTTIRETTEDSDYVGNVGRQALQSGKGYQTTNWYAPNTNRQFTADYEYTGGAHGTQKKTTSYDSSYNAQTNPNKEIIAQGRKPTRQSIKVTNGPSHITMQSRRIDEDSINWRSAVKTSSVGDYFNPQAITSCTNTSEKNYLPQHDTRLDPTILDAYKRNPLTHSLQSYN